RPDARLDRAQGGLGLPHRLDRAVLDALQIVAVHAGARRAPQPEGVGTVVGVRAGDQNVREAREARAPTLRRGVAQAGQVPRDEGNLLLAVAQHDGAGEERVVDFRRLAVLAEAGEVDRLGADGGRDVGLAEAGSEAGAGLLRFLLRRAQAADGADVAQHNP